MCLLCFYRFSELPEAVLDDFLLNGRCDDMSRTKDSYFSGGCKLQVAGCRCRLQVAGCRCRLQVAGCRLQVAGAGCRWQVQVAGCRLQCRLQVASIFFFKQKMYDLYMVRFYLNFFKKIRIVSFVKKPW